MIALPCILLIDTQLIDPEVANVSFLRAEAVKKIEQISVQSQHHGP